MDVLLAQLHIEWRPVITLPGNCVSVGETMCAGDVFDYEVGLSSVSSASAAPDLHGYTSTNQHAHIIFRHLDVLIGQEFWIHIKSTSKAEVEGIQVVIIIVCFYTRYLFVQP